MGTTESIIVVLVVIGLRLLLPLTIPYFPLVGVVACLILDAVDQTIFQQFPAIPLDGYQSYDKALDIYYLTITYLSTFRNWTNQPAFRINQFLFYYRLVGVAAFELTQTRALLLVFPNTFEYFFIFYELVRMRWDPAPHGQEDGDRRGGAHLGVHQAAAGVVDPHRPAGHDRLHQRGALRRGPRFLVGRGGRGGTAGAGGRRRCLCGAGGRTLVGRDAQGPPCRPRPADQGRSSAAGVARR